MLVTYYAKVRAHEGRLTVVDIDCPIPRMHTVTLTAGQVEGARPDVGIVGTVALYPDENGCYAVTSFRPLANTPENQAAALATSLILEKRRQIEVCAEGLSGHLVQLASDECDAIAAKHRDTTGEDVGLNTDDTLDLDDEDVLKVLKATIERIEARLKLAASLVTGDEAALVEEP